jgi:quercetin dioxygenase-like cupin family protein
MQDRKTHSGKVVIIGPEGGESFWQPVPANGFVRNLLNNEVTGASLNFSMSMQTVAPGCFIREHTHDRNEEIAYVIEGQGSVRVDDDDRPIERGSCVFLGLNRKHRWNNPGPGPLTLLILFVPGGLDKFHAEIGRPRRAGDAPPTPFERPDNIAEIEARTVFGWTDLGLKKSDPAGPPAL